MSLWRRNLGGMASGAGSVALKTGLNIVVVPVLLAHLGLDAFGFYMLLVGVLELSMLLDLGVSAALVKLLGGETEDSHQRRAYLKAGHGLFLGLGLVLLLLGLSASPWINVALNLPVELAAIAPLGLALIIAESALTLYGCYYQSILLAHCEHQWSNLADSLYSILINVGALVLLFAGFHLPEILMVRLAAAALRLGFMAMHALRLEPFAWRPRVPLNGSVVREMAHLSGHAMMINLSIIVSHKIDVVLIAMFLPIGMVGVYELVFRLLGLIIQVSLKISEGVLPLYARMASAGERPSACQLFLRMSSLLNFIAVMTIMLVVSFYSELLTTFSSGQVTVEQTWPVLLVAIPIIISGVLQMPANAWLFSWGHQRFLTVSSLAAAGCNLLLSLALVRPLGLIGVALGTAVPQLLQHQFWLIRKTCRELDISGLRYLRAVHGAILIPVGVSFLWVQIWRPLASEAALPLLPIALIAASAMFLGFVLWFGLSASTLERDILTQKLIRPLQGKLGWASPHG